MEIKLTIFYPDKNPINKYIKIPKENGIYTEDGKFFLYSEKLFRNYINKIYPYSNIDIFYDYYDNETEYILETVFINYTNNNYRKIKIKKLLHDNNNGESKK